LSFPVVPAGCDLAIASPDASAATVYQGLTRRDPIVIHGEGRPHQSAHSAVILVTLAGTEAASERWDVQFAAPRAIPVSGGRRPTSPAPGAPRQPETITVKWDGADTITGVVMAETAHSGQLEIRHTKTRCRPVQHPFPAHSMAVRRPFSECGGPTGQSTQGLQPSVHWHVSATQRPQ
jgi:hypothetical protein